MQIADYSFGISLWFLGGEKERFSVWGEFHHQLVYCSIYWWAIIGDMGGMEGNNFKYEPLK